MPDRKSLIVRYALVLAAMLYIVGGWSASWPHAHDHDSHAFGEEIVVVEERSGDEPQQDDLCPVCEAMTQSAEPRQPVIYGAASPDQAGPGAVRLVAPIRSHRPHPPVRGPPLA